MTHTKFALERPITTTMLFVALAAVGIIALRLLPLEKFPDIEFPGIFVQIPYVGSTPEEVERLITRPVEEVLATMSGVEQMFSSSSENQAQIFLSFGWDESMGAKGIEARSKVDSVLHRLPDDIRRIFVFTGSLSDQPVMQLRISSDRDLSDSFDMLDRLLKRRIERIEGVSRAELQGVDPKEIRILLDADRMAAHKIDIGRLLEVAERSNFAVSAGRVTDSNQRLTVRPFGEFRSISDIEDLVVNNKGIRLRDIAKIELVSPERDYGRHLDRSYAIGIAITKATGANMVDVTDKIIAEVEKIRTLPQMRDINIFQLENQGDNVRDSLKELLSAGAIGALFAVAVLYVFLRQVTTTAIVVATIPLSLLITIGMLYFAGLSLNILTLTGLMLAIGMLVDNAVVVTESIFRNRAVAPNRPFSAAIRGVSDVGLAVTAGTATTIIVFLPTMFGARNEVTVFLTHVALTIIVALVASLLIAQTLIPMLAARIAPPPASRPTSPMSRLIRSYGHALEWVLEHSWKTFGGIVAICVIGAAPVALQLVKFDAFPQESGRRLFLPYHIEGQHPLDRVEEAVNIIEEYLLSRKEEFNIRSVYSYYDRGRAESTLLLTDRDEATLPTKEIIELIESDLPAIAIGKPNFQFRRDGGVEGFSIQISGHSTEILNDIAIDHARSLEAVEGLKDIRSDGESGEREVRVSIDRIRASGTGLTTRDIADAIALALRGKNLREFRGETGEIEVRFAFRANDKQTISQLADLPLITRDGRLITLSSVANFSVGHSPDIIRRIDRETAVALSANLDAKTSLNDVRPRIEELMEQFELPPGYSWKFGRGFEREDETQQTMAINIALGVACIFLVMAALFESLILPFSIILGSIVFSIFGVFLFFAVTGTTFSLMASIGIMILIGVVVNNGIVLVDRINNLRAKGVRRNDAIIRAGQDRLRPILMTVLTTILGLSPLALGTTQIGGDGPPYFPMARAIIGGLAFSTLVSLLVVPAFYAYFDSLSNWGRKVLRLARDPDSLPKRAAADAVR